MGVTNISTVSQITVMYSNSSGASLVFELLKELLPDDPRVLEVVVVAKGVHVFNVLNRTMPCTIAAKFNEITEDARDILSQAFETQDDSGVLTALMPKSNKMRIWKVAVPDKNEIYNQKFEESIVAKEVIINFTCSQPEDKLLS
jgi:hypothetical protein